MGCGHLFCALLSASCFFFFCGLWFVIRLSEAEEYPNDATTQRRNDGTTERRNDGVMERWNDGVMERWNE